MTCKFCAWIFLNTNFSQITAVPLILHSAMRLIYLTNCANVSICLYSSRFVRRLSSVVLHRPFLSPYLWCKKTQPPLKTRRGKIRPAPFAGSIWPPSKRGREWPRRSASGTYKTTPRNCKIIEKCECRYVHVCVWMYVSMCVL